MPEYYDSDELEDEDDGQGHAPAPPPMPLNVQKSTSREVRRDFRLVHPSRFDG